MQTFTSFLGFGWENTKPKINYSTDVGGDGKPTEATELCENP
jgi:hypothetical protein